LLFREQQSVALSATQSDLSKVSRSNSFCFVYRWRSCFFAGFQGPPPSHKEAAGIWWWCKRRRSVVDPPRQQRPPTHHPKYPGEVFAFQFIMTSSSGSVSNTRASSFFFTPHDFRSFVRSNFVAFLDVRSFALARVNWTLAFCFWKVSRLCIAGGYLGERGGQVSREREAFFRV
jgi:hypothetical protein